MSVVSSVEDEARVWRNLRSQLHRTDGPAIENADGSKFWYQNNQVHRTDGPAIEWANGYKYWYLFGKEYDEQTYYRVLKCLVLL